MEYCLSIKNKKSPGIKCTRKAKPNCKFCGYHLNNPTIFKAVYTELPKIENVDPYILKLTLDKNNIVFDKKDTSRNLYQKFSTFIENKTLNETLHNKKIIKIQSICRKKLVQRKINNVNDTDFYTLDNITNIPNIYFYCVKEVGKKYAFDIRSLDTYIKHTHGKNIINPFTNMPFLDKSLICIKSRIKYLYNKKKLKEEITDVLSTEQNFNQFMFGVFRLYDELGFITQLKWFTNLNILQLKSLYKIGEDIWNYRAQLSFDKKNKITNNGIAFQLSPVHILKCPPSKIKKLQYVILNEFRRLASEGQTDSDRKLGAMLMLTAFVEVSPEVANAFPWLVQR